MQVFQTAGVPPSNGSSIFATSGWIEKSRAELTKIVTPKSSVFREVFIMDFVRKSEPISL
jgi:hypothetical protein